jgi:fatty-acyl-CoA synthase
MTIVDLLADAAHDGVRMRFLPDHPEAVSGTRVWEDAGRAAGWLAQRTPPGAAVAALLEATPHCVAALVGAWRAGCTLVSLPLRSRTQDPGQYGAMIRQLIGAAGATMVLADPRSAAVLGGQQVPVVAYPECLADGPAPADRPGGRFIQFSSGTTARPKGISLSLSALGANVAALLDAVAHESPVIYSWLPLSHDMGLVGVLLTGWAMGGARYAGSSDITLARPESFLLAPSSWMRACGDLRATATAAPAFALRMAARRPLPAGTDLSSLRVLVTGAEPVEPAALRRFTEQAHPARLDPRAICPAYGLAEVGVAATLVPAGALWSSVTVDTEALADGRWEPSPAGTEFAGAGTPLSGTEIRIAGEPGRPGEILVRSRSVMDGYLNDGAGTFADGWLRTGDIGYVDGDLYVLGRRDDVIIVRGANLYPAFMEAALSDALDGRLRLPTVVPWQGSYAVVAEGGRPTGGTGTDVGHSVRAILARTFGVAPARIAVVRAGTLPRTPSGKVQRHAVRQRMTAGQLTMSAHWDFGDSEETS